MKADSLGSLEALLVLLKQKGIRVMRAGIGPITKKDVYSASALIDENKVLLGFNVDFAEEGVEDEVPKDMKVLTDEVVYKLIENFEEWKGEKLKAIERKKLDELPTICKFTILDFVFRNSVFSSCDADDPESAKNKYTHLKKKLYTIVHKG